MTWQKCPVCNGTGKKVMSLGDEACPTCEGHGIIHEVTGRPPENRVGTEVQKIQERMWIKKP